MKTRLLRLTVLVLILTLIPTVSYATGCDPANIIFSEIDYDQPGTDSTEFIELRIPNTTTISNCVLRLINGATPNAPTVYRTIDLAGTYPANKYLVIGSTGVPQRDITIGGSCATDCIQNGSNDGFALVDTTGAGTLVWFISYEGQITNYNPGDGSSNSSENLPVQEDNNAPNKSINNGTGARIADSYLNEIVTPGTAGPNAILLSNLAATSHIAALPGFVLLALGGAALYRRCRRQTA